MYNKVSVLISLFLLVITASLFAMSCANNGDTAIEIIIDNRDIDFYITIGQWGTCNQNECDGICYNQDFRYANPRAQGDTDVHYRAYFRPNFTAKGKYQVYLWWPKGADRAIDAPVIINHANGSTTLSINLRENGDYWFNLGAYDFSAGDKGTIVLEDSETGYVNADAIRFIPL